MTIRADICDAALEFLDMLVEDSQGKIHGKQSIDYVCGYNACIADIRQWVDAARAGWPQEPMTG